MGLLVELQKRIPDRWFLRRLLPAGLFVALALVGGGQLGQRHWNDLGLARERIAAALRLSRGTTADGAAVLVLVAVAVVAAALAVPFAAGAIGALASGSWPWWLAPPGRRLTAWRVRRWAPPGNIAREAVRARAAGRELRADRLDARRARSAPVAPSCPTWSGDRFRAAEAEVRARTGLDVADAWTGLLLTLPDTSRTTLSEAREGYDAACEGLAWSIAVTFLGVWWWPAALLGIVLWLAFRQALRRAVEGLCRTTTAVFALRHDLQHDDGAVPP
ncbi:hypothetical protein Slala03_50920 [Streptomyces lavendulae subsp. lavendulae]|uniref:hypothetical protein n=1 Tax=Streptomyces lavendulae TaxID=1914 RepID=UPI0024A41FF6|nr:hypothetical protein [Streptomyces lavendulae]GLV85403.1 hypothetical protein Slala03_50920 [Streptomyces lavendulae subsp. lavendulae]